MNIFELFGSVGLKGIDQTKQQLSGLEKHTQQVQKGMRIMGAALTGVGVAGLAMIQSTKKINAQLGVTALNLGITTKEMRDLTLATTNVTFPIDEVTKTFDLLARAGVKDQKVLEATATAFDTLGDAIGVPASLVTKQLIPAMKTFNISAAQMADKTDALTWLFRNTTVNLEDFNRMVGYTTPELVAMGLTTEDMIAILAELEEQGYSGEVMTREFRKAVTNATKEQIPLNEALGISAEKIEGYKVEMEGAVGLTQEYADVANKQYTLMDKLRQKWSELTLKASAFLEPLEPILASMTAMGPLMIALSTSAGTAAIKWALHTAALVAHKIAAYASAAANWALHASMGPIGWAIAAISLAIAVLIPLLRVLTGETKEASAGMDDYTKSLFQNEVAVALTVDEWIKAYEQGYLLEEQIDRIASRLRISTSELLDNMQAADMLEVSMSSGVDTGRVYIKQLQEQTTELEKVKQATQELTSEQQALNSSWEDFLKRIKPSTKAFGDYGLTSEDVIKYLAETQGGIDAVIESLKEQGIAANDVRYYLDELGISAKDVADFVGKKKRAVTEETEVDIGAANAISDLNDKINELGDSSRAIEFPTGVGTIPGTLPGEGYVTPEALLPEVSPFVIQVDGMTIREEADIYKVAEELYRLSQDKTRATGG